MGFFVRLNDIIKPEEVSVMSTESSKYELKPSSIDDNWMNTNVVQFQTYHEPSDNEYRLDTSTTRHNNNNNNLQLRPNQQPSSIREVHSHSKSVPNFQFRHTKSHETLIPNLSDNSIHSHFQQQYNQHNSGDNINDGKSDFGEMVRRSKSTGQIHKKNWNSIHNEKNFLKNINQNLLPSVLKTGESPILALKRQQVLNTEVPPLPPHDLLSQSTNPREDSIPEVNKPINQPSKLKKKYELTDDDDDCSINLPHISEFDEPLDQKQFESFDQDYNLDIDESKYQNSLNGLESIPKSLNKSENHLNWLTTTKSLNHISLNQWNQHQQHYKNIRSRSGIMLNAGMTRLVSDHHLNDSNMTLINDDLLPPIENRADNIDDLSDIQSSTSHRKPNHSKDNSMSRPMFNHLNRSYSAPSLHTFRNVSNSSKASDLSHVEPTSFQRCQTPPPIEVGNDGENESIIKSSPLKRFLSQSPKKYFRKSMDIKDYASFNHSHKHNGSIISSTFSVYSNSSKSSSPKRSRSHKSVSRSQSISRSISPKRSLKILLPRKPSTTVNFPSGANPPPNTFISPPNLLKRAIVNHNLYDDEIPWDLETSKSSNNSRVSSLPSAIIGEYDREKWTTLKTLQHENKI